MGKKRSTSSICIASFILLTVVSLTGIGWADGKCSAGYLTKFGPNIQTVTVTRADSSIVPVELWMALCPGDTVALDDKSPDAFVILELSRGAEKLNKNRRTYKVPQSETSIDSADGLIRKLGKVVRFWAPSPYSNNSPNLMIRGPEEPVQIPLFTGSVLKLVAGQRTIALAWTGGQAPFRFEIHRGKERIFNKLLEQNALPPSDVEFSLGNYTLMVTDTAGKKTTYNVAVQENIPELPEQLITSFMSKDFAAVVRASWLSRVDNGVWRWEALLELLPYTRDNPAAVALAGALLNGDQL